MAKTTALRLIAAVTAVTVIAVAGWAESPSTARAQPGDSIPSEIEAVAALRADSTTTTLTEEQQQLVDWARSRFVGAGLDAPDVTFSFHDSTLDCGGHIGVYLADTDTVHMCRLERWTMLHELSHAWAERHLTDEDRAAFTALRGLEHWLDGDDAWADRAAEHAAEIMAWGLMNDDTTVAWVEPDGRRTRTLLTIADSEPRQLAEAFTALTGLEPIYRVADLTTPVTTTASDPARSEAARFRG